MESIFVINEADGKVVGTRKVPIGTKTVLYVEEEEFIGGTITTTIDFTFQTIPIGPAFAKVIVAPDLEVATNLLTDEGCDGDCENCKLN